MIQLEVMETITNQQDRFLNNNIKYIMTKLKVMETITNQQDDILNKSIDRYSGFSLSGIISLMPKGKLC